MSELSSIDEALKAFAEGKIVIVVDDEDRENEGDFIQAAEKVTPESINFMATVGRGLICTPLTKALAQRLEIPPMVQNNTSSHETAFTISIDAAENIGTGISSKDRSTTIKLLCNDRTKASDFVRPGHIFPLVAKDGGVIERPGHTEAAVEMAKLCGLAPVGIICEIMNTDGTMARLPELQVLAEKHDLHLISIEQLIKYTKERQV